jgi:hypothetical protein
MSHKTTTLYTEILTCILEESVNRNVQIHWTNVKTDFEDALINSVHDIFPEVNVNGCYFHFSQAINRWIQINGLIGECI